MELPTFMETQPVLPAQQTWISVLEVPLPWGFLPGTSISARRGFLALVSVLRC